MSTGMRLAQMSRCFQGIVPCILATAGRDHTPNVTYISHVQVVDDDHIALSRQFFNKTQQNLTENPYASLQVHDALTFEAYQLQVRYLRSESSGPLFESMSARVDAIATHTGMVGVFRVTAADLCEVLSIEPLDFLVPDAALEQPRASAGFGHGRMGELRGLQLVSDRINRASDLEGLLASALEAFDELFGLQHSMVLHPDETGQRLVTIASRGYGTSGIGAEVTLGEGLIGVAAARRTPVLNGNLSNDLLYGRAVRGRIEAESGSDGMRPEIPLPGLPNADSQLALPMLLEDELLGVLAFESEERDGFEHWQQAFLQVLANQLAIGIDRLRRQDDDTPLERTAAVAPVRTATPADNKKRTFMFFRNDDCVFVDGQYLVRNVPGKILWKILSEHAQGARTSFTNRELRLDPTLGLPAIKDNLESRLILLRKRLDEKCPDVRLVPTERGRFALELACSVELVERAHG